MQPCPNYACSKRCPQQTLDCCPLVLSFCSLVPLHFEAVCEKGETEEAVVFYLVRLLVRSLAPAARNDSCYVSYACFCLEVVSLGI